MEKQKEKAAERAQRKHVPLILQPDAEPDEDTLETDTPNAETTSVSE
jgi:hypothetical protein